MESASCAKMLTDTEKKEARALLLLLPDEDVMSLAKTCTNVQQRLSTATEATEGILASTKNASQLLHRQKVKREILYQYLCSKGISVPLQSGKNALIQRVLELWSLATSSSDIPLVAVSQTMENWRISHTLGSVSSVTYRDIRFPTRLEKDGSDSINDPDYSCVYVTITSSSGDQGFGLTFTIGRGTEIVCAAVKAYGRLLIGKELNDVFKNFGSFWQELVHEPQLRWLGPEKGVTHLALAAIINALWDLWARSEGKPLWKLLVDMDPEQLVSVIDFRYITDALTKEEAIEILKKGQEGKEEREATIQSNGYPAYTTSAGWLGYSDEKIEKLCKQALAEGFTRFKVKVGLDRKDDEHRVAFVRRLIGDDKMLMVDANQRWGIEEAVEWMKPLARYNLTWIEEPTSPDDILGHAKIAAELSKYSIGVATGENCPNRVVFKQLLQAKAIQFCQIDSCRMAGPNEILAVYLMAAKFGVPVCPHAGGVGLCELVQHLSIFDYVCISKSLDKRVIEYVDHLHSHFVDPVVIRNGCYQTPLKPGYSAEMKQESLNGFEYPGGSEWQKLFAQGTLYKHPDEE